MIAELSKLNYIVLSLIYLLFGIFISFFTIRNFLKTKKVKLIYFFNLYYLITYSITPIFTLKSIADGDYFKYLKTSDIKYYYLSCLGAIVLFFVFMVAYFFIIYRLKDKKNIIKNNKIKRMFDINIYDKKFFIINCSLLAFSWFCLIMWIKAYGLPFGIFKYASDIRDSVCDIPNKWSFLSKFCGIFIFTTYYCIFNVINMVKLKKFSFKIVIAFLCSLFGCFVYLIAIDSRSSLMMFFVILILALLHNVIEKINMKKIVILIVSFFAIVLIANNLQNIMNVIKGDKIVKNNNNFFVSEFSYRVLNNINTFYMLDNEEYNIKLRFVDNIIELPFSWFPSSKLPSFVENMNAYNTSFYEKERGSFPVDLLTASLFSLGYIGILLNPLLYGFILGMLELFFYKKGVQNIFYKIIFYDLCCILMGNFINYSDMAPIINAYFSFSVYYISVLFFWNILIRFRSNFNEKKEYI